MEMSEKKALIYEFGSFVLNLQEKSLTCGGSPVHLPAKEFDTLVMLVENNGRALSKGEMLSAIWDESFVEEGNLAKQISRLRKIFNTNGEEFIETIPKHGYRFTADLRRTSPAIDDGVILEKRTVKRMTVAFEEEPDPVPAQTALPEPTEPFVTRPRIAGVLSIVAIVAVGAVWFLIPRMRPPAMQINTVAVLPLRPLNDDEDGRALGLGIADALITKLGSLKRVIVRPTGAAGSFSAQADPIEAARKLNVDAVLEGTIQQADGRLRVNARLLRTSTGEQIWAEKFDQPEGELFALQDALSTNIAKTLAFELSKSDSEKLLRRGTENAEAYEKYLRGRFYQTQNTAVGLNRSIEFYEQAIALDPNFAEAHAGIADANVILFNFNIRPAAQTIPQARMSLNRALQLNPDLSNSYTALALIQFLIDRNWPEAEQSLQRAIELDQSNADAYHRYGYFLTRLGRFDDALDKFDMALDLNPLSAISQSGKGMTFLCARRYSEAIAILGKTAADNPQFSFPQWLLATTYEATGDNERAFEANLKALEIEAGSALAEQLRKIKNENGLEAANKFWLDESVKAGQDGPLSPLVIAMRAATVKDREQTLFWLEKALEEGDTTLGGIKFFIKFDFVRDEPRFQAVVSKLSY